jgi:hypothetical protein
MKKLGGCVLGMCLMAAFAVTAAAQEVMDTPPKVLVVTREFVKPGKNGPEHEKTESMFVDAMRKAKWPTHYLGLESLSGKNRALFLTGYDSFAAWEKDFADQQKNPVLAGALQHAYTADSALLESLEQSVWVYRPDQSFNPTKDVWSMRAMEFEVFHLKPGHEGDWNEAVKLVKDAYAKGVPDAHWDMFQLMYGGSPSYVVITPMKGAAEVDKNLMSDKQFMEAMGPEGMKKLSELSREAIESIETNLFMFNPHMSYVPESAVAAAPDFWKPKAAHAAGEAKAKKAEETPAKP